MTKEEAIELLAEKLQFKTEHLDPGEGRWADLDEKSRSFYRHCVKWLLAFPEVVLTALDPEIVGLRQTVVELQQQIDGRDACEERDRYDG